MAQIVKELVTKWTYKVDAAQVKAAVKSVKGLKKQMAGVKKDSSQFASSEVQKVNRVKKAWSGLHKKVRDYRSEVGRTAKRGGGVGGGMGGGFKTFAAARALGLGAGAAAGVAAGGGIAALTGVAGAFRAGAGAEVAQIEYEGFLKSADKAKKLLGELADFGSRTPFEIPQLEQLGAQLLAGGFAAKELIPTLGRLGDVTGANSERLNRMLINLIQIRLNNRAYTQDLKQFAMANIPIFTELAKNLGKTSDEIREMTKRGEIDFKTVNDALISMTTNGGTFEGRMARVAKTLIGRLSNLKDAFFKLGRELSVNVIPALSGFTHSISVSVEGIAEGVKWVSKFGKTWRVVGVAMAAAFGFIFPTVASIGILLLAVEDLVAFMQGRGSIIGDFFSWLGGGFQWAADVALDFFAYIKSAAKTVTDLIPDWVFRYGGGAVDMATGLVTGNAAMAQEGLSAFSGGPSVTVNQNNNVGLRGGESAEAAGKMINNMSDGALRSAGRRVQNKREN